MKNKRFYRDYHKYDTGGIINWLNNTGEKLSGNNPFGLTNSGMGLASGILNVGSGIFNNVINPSGNQSDVGNTLQTIGSLASNIPGVGGLIGAGVNAIGGIYNAAFGSNINEEAVSNIRNNIAERKNFQSNATTNNALLSDWAMNSDLSHVSKSQVGSDGWFSDDASDLTRKLNKEIDEANLRAYNSLANTGFNIDKINDFNRLSNYRADGGDIHIKKANRGKFTDYCGGKVTSACIQRGLHSSNPTTRKRANFARNARKWKHEDGGYVNRMDTILNSYPEVSLNEEPWAIEYFRNNPNIAGMAIGAGLNGIQGKRRVIVNPYNKFMNDPIQRGGLLTNERLRHYMDETNFNLPNISDEQINKYKGTSYENDTINIGRTEAARYLVKDKSNSLTEEQIKYVESLFNKRELGGPLTHGLDINNNVTIINNGGTHEENPYDGVQLGVDENNIPNLVEEGEVIFNNYVYSNRLKPSNSMKKKNKYKGNTYAEIAKNLQKESQERPNDPISKRGLEDGLNRLAILQENQREKKDKNRFDVGGIIKTPINDAMEMTELPNTLDYYSVPTNTTATNKRTNMSYMRYAPILGHAMGVVSDIFSAPDYSAAERLESEDLSPALTSFTPVGNYLTYSPLDKNYYLNKLDANAGATRRAIRNTSGGNRAAMLAGLLASDYNYGNQLGELSRKAEEYNQQLKERVEGFNRLTDMYNSEAGFKSSMANAESRNKMKQLSLSRAGNAAALRQAAKDAYDARRTNNVNVLLEELGGLGTELTQKNWLDILADSGVLKIDTNGNFIGRSNGGKIKTKKKKGYTYG